MEKIKLQNFEKSEALKHNTKVPPNKKQDLTLIDSPS